MAELDTSEKPISQKNVMLQMIVFATRAKKCDPVANVFNCS